MFQAHRAAQAREGGGAEGPPAHSSKAGGGQGERVEEEKVRGWRRTR